MSRNFTAIVYWEEDVYIAQCPEVGTASQGDTIEEAIANLKEATELYFDYNPVPPKHSKKVMMRAQFKGQGKPLPYPLDEE